MAPDNYKASIMIVDDTPANLKLLSDLLQSCNYHVLAFPAGEMALRAARKNPPDLFLLDINMPQINGYDLCDQLKNSPETAEIPVIFLSALNQPLDKVRAFGVGAVDYINKPFQFEEVLARVQTHIKIRRLQVELEKYNQHLQYLVQEQVKEIESSQLATIVALAKLAESRDDDTGQHLERVQFFSRLLTDGLRKYRVYEDVIDSSYSSNIFYACSLHDIGKVGIPDHILLKPGKLNDEEFEIMKTHTLIGAENLESVYKKYPNNKLVRMGIAIARSHHERWDGSGYPDGLGGQGIPLPARIMSLVDVYDALRSERCYKAAFSHDKARKIIREGSGSQFDPAIIEVFNEIEADFERVFNYFSQAENTYLNVAITP